MWLRSACRTRDPSGSTRVSSAPVTSVLPSGSQLAAQPLPPPPGPMTSVFTSRSTATISSVPQFENQRRPSCHRGDSPIPRPSNRTRISRVEESCGIAHLLPCRSHPWTAAWVRRRRPPTIMAARNSNRGRRVPTGVLLQDDAASTGGGAKPSPASSSDERHGAGHHQRDPRQERTTPNRAGEGVRFLRQPDVEDQDDREERDIAAGRRADDATMAQSRGAVRAAVWSRGRPGHRPLPGEGHHRDEQRVRRDQRGKDRSEHGSGPEEEGPPSDEEMPAEPEPQPEQEEAPEWHRHERPEEVRQRGPLGAVGQPDALPDQERPDDPEPPDDRDRSHTRHLRDIDHHLVLSVPRDEDEDAPTTWELAMVEAIVLVQIKVGESSSVAQAIGEVGGVTEAYVVTGPYDVIARVEADSLDVRGRMVVTSIQAVEGVTRTLTCPILSL